MNLAELQAKLQQSKVPNDAYCLTGGLPNEAYCIERQADGQWSTYYSERGSRSGLQTFDTEQAACQHLYDRIVREVL